MSMKTLTRLSYIDILKIVATFAIVLWHVSAVYVRMDAALFSPLGALPYVINLCVRFALPMFMMISGRCSCARAMLSTSSRSFPTL